MVQSCVIIGDLRGSREIDDWERVLRSLKSSLQSISKKYKEEVLVDFAPTVGDEFQGVLRSPKHAYDVCMELFLTLGTDIYCGIGIGEVERPLGDVGMRGTAFYRAREALERCKKDKRRLYIVSKEGENLRDLLLNTLFRVIEETVSSWTKRQREIATYLWLNPKLSIEEVGRHFSITKQNVSKILKSAHWALLEEVEGAIRTLLSQPVSVDIDLSTKKG
jgi:predicted DNA-binding protein YlxM (UPF0122 family)